MATPYMTLSLPSVGVTPGPAWATAINAALSVVDAHDHSPGKGVPVRASGLYMDAGLAFNEHDATGLRSTRFVDHASVLATPFDLGCLYAKGGELHYNDGTGTAIQLTSGGALNTASLGAIGGDYSTAGASLFYTSASKLFSFESSAGVKAHAALGNLSIYEAVSGGKAATLKVPTGLAASYQLTLPAALPGATKILTIDNTGQIASAYDVDASTLEVASNTLRVKDGGITGAKLNASAADASTLEVASGAMRVKDLGVTTGKIANLGVTTAKIADLNVTTAKIADLNVTRAKIEAVGHQISASCGSFSTTSATLVDVTNLSVTLATTGRPVMVMLQSDGAGAALGIARIAGSGNAFGFVVFSRTGANDFAEQTFGIQDAALSIQYSFPAVMAHLDTPAAGTYTYKVQARCFGAQMQAYVSNAKLVVYEL